MIGKLLSLLLVLSFSFHPLVFILHLLYPKGRRQGGKVLHSYWRRTMVRRAKNSTHANSAKVHATGAFLCPLADWYFVLFSWLEFRYNGAKICCCSDICCMRETIHMPFNIIQEHATTRVKRIHD